MKIINLFIYILSMASLSFIVFAKTNHLEQAIQHIEAAIAATNGHVVAEHAEMAKIYINGAKDKEDPEVDLKHLDESIRSLDEAVEKGKNGNPVAAKQAARDALNHLMDYKK